MWRTSFEGTAHTKMIKFKTPPMERGIEKDLKALLEKERAAAKAFARGKAKVGGLNGMHASDWS